MNRETLLARKDYPVWSELTTRWGDNDAYGHVNNTVYYSWFDTVVNSWLIDAGLLDIVTGDLQWINVGHPAPFLIRGGEVLQLGACEPTLPVGLGDGRVAEIASDVMSPGDRLCCITDGVVDAHRPGGEDFGEQRVRRVRPQGAHRLPGVQRASADLAAHPQAELPDRL